MSLENPKVTVLMPVYNGEQYLSEAIESILNQTFTDFEFLIINDGSTDRSVDIIESYDDPRIQLVHNGKNLKLITTLNRGIDLARGEYIARMDSDDISLPDRLAKQVEFLDTNPLCAVVAVKITQIDASGRLLGDWKGDRGAVTAEGIRKHLPVVNCIAHPGVMMRKSIVSRYRYDPSQRHAEDYDLWLRLCSDGYRIEKIGEPLLKYRVHGMQVTSINSQVGYGIADIRVKANFLLRRLIRLNLGRFDLKVLLGLFRDMILFIPKLTLKLVTK